MWRHFVRTLCDPQGDPEGVPSAARSTRCFSHPKHLRRLNEPLATWQPLASSGRPGAPERYRGLDHRLFANCGEWDKTLGQVDEALRRVISGSRRDVLG